MILCCTSSFPLFLMVGTITSSVFLRSTKDTIIKHHYGPYMATPTTRKRAMSNLFRKIVVGLHFFCITTKQITCTRYIHSVKVSS